MASTHPPRPLGGLLLAAVVVVGSACVANEWDDTPALESEEPSARGDGGYAPPESPAGSAGEAGACDGVDNDGDGTVDEGCTCTLGSSQACYPGRAADLATGAPCSAGTQLCIAEGEFASWGPCEGAVTPAAEVCWNGVDEDCDGEADDGCTCAAGDGRRCYEGPEGTRGVGACRPGEETCLGEGMGWSLCEGQVLPSEEVCDDGVDNDCDGEADEGCVSPVDPVACTAATLTHVVGAASCGPDQAVYMMDDGDGPNFVCCPLPATDIVTDDPPQPRGATCGPDEVITGASGPYALLCSRINTARYRLAAPRRPCYFGDGYAGASGVSRCADHPHTFSVLHAAYFGSDGCSGQPYGALFVSQTGDDCQNLSAAELQYTGEVEGDPAGAPVPMFAE